MLNKGCNCSDNLKYGELLFVTQERTRRVREDLAMLYRLLPCPDKCNDVTEVLCLIQKELTSILEDTEILIECFNRDCFICTPDTIFANILEVDCLIEGALGQVSYLNFLQNQDQNFLCLQLEILRFTLEVVDLSYRFLQNALRTFYCEESC